jgi:hypothetical protein
VSMSVKDMKPVLSGWLSNLRRSVLELEWGLTAHTEEELTF